MVCRVGDGCFKRVWSGNVLFALRPAGLCFVNGRYGPRSESYKLPVVTSWLCCVLISRFLCFCFAVRICDQC